MDQVKVTKWQHKLLTLKPNDPELVAAAEFRPSSRIKPLTSLRLYPAHFLAWTQVRYMEIHDEAVDNFDLWEKCERADQFNLLFSKAAHEWEIPLMVRRLKPKPLRADNPTEARIDYYVEFRKELNDDERRALVQHASQAAHAFNKLQFLEFRDRPDGISVYVDEN